ncbi:MAG: hypothetical protein AAGH82_01985, partial [Pseudomonadota bacterium]
IAPVAALVAGTIALGIFAGPLFALTDGAADGLQNPAAYVSSVFPAGAPVTAPMDITPPATATAPTITGEVN